MSFRSSTCKNLCQEVTINAVYIREQMDGDRLWIKKVEGGGSMK